jgi:hypothetical protein
MSFSRAGLFPAQRRHRQLVVVSVVLVLLAPIGFSIDRALTYPGSASWQLRLVEWTRDHGGAPVVNAVENWYYSRRRPGAGPPAPGSTLAPPQGGSFSVQGRPQPVPEVVAPALPGEGAWQPLGRSGADGRPLVWATWYRPDGSNSSVTVGVASIDMSRVRAELIAGTRDPGGTWAEGARVPPDQLGRLVAAFNAGFKFGDTPGGFATDGRVSRPLVDGLAAAVITRDGRLSVRRWTGGSGLPPGVRAVRENLDLIVDAGRPAPGLGSAGSRRWGNSRTQLQYTWRSAIGTTGDGRLLYVAGNRLNLAELADALVQGGATVGMQLDIHPALVTFNTYRPGPAGVTGTKLLPAMTRPATRYLTPDQRDFFALLAR